MTLTNPWMRALFVCAPLLLVSLSITAVCAGQDAKDETKKEKILGTDSAFAGMVDVPAGEFKMGIDVKALKKMFEKSKRETHPILNGKEKGLWWGILMLETPEHEAETEAYSIGRYEQTNAQYFLWLDTACKESEFTTTKMDTIHAVATKVYGQNPSDWQMQTIYWLNEEKLLGMKAKVYEANKKRITMILDEHNDGLPLPAQVKKFDDLPEPIRVQNWLTFSLPEGTALTVYTRTAPQHWAKAVPTEEQMGRPVRYVSVRDANAYGEWSGKHLPSEQEWEKAARGPKGWLYPWGPTWDCVKQKDLLIWQNTTPEPRGPAPATKDRPIEVDRLPLGQSGYGCFHMLGNVSEWTSSIPEKHPRSDAKSELFGRPDLRVVRGGAYGSGKPYKNMELELRCSTRYIDPSLGVDNTYGAVGLRMAKYPTPARDVLTHRVREISSTGFLPKALTFDPARTYGIELPDYAAKGAEGVGKVFVKGPTRVVGVVPLEMLEFSISKAVVEASRKSVTDGTEPVILGYLYWNADIEVEVLEIVQPVKAVPEKPTEGAPEEGAPEEGAPEEGAPEDGKPAEEGAEEKPKPDEKPAADEEPVPAEGEAEAVPKAKPTEQLTRLAGADHGYLLGLANGRLALYRPAFSGPKLFGYFPLLEGQTAETVFTKTKLKEFQTSATIDPETGIVTVKLALKTRSQTSKDVFGVDLKFKIHGQRSGTWLQMPAK